MSPAPPFCYEGFDLDPERGLLTCRYSLGGRDFTEEITFGPGGNWDDPGGTQAARLVELTQLHQERRDLEAATRIQKSFLPSERPRVPEPITCCTSAANSMTTSTTST